MEESFTLNWDDATSVHVEEEICGIETENIIEPEAGHFEEVCEEVVVQSSEPNTDNSGQVLFLSDEQLLEVIPQTNTPGDSFLDCQVAEEVVTEDWGANCNELVVGNEEHVGDVEEDDIVPLPADQDQYSALRPYPCDFCSRRFRKKVNLMNHMVAHQTDKPHGCNLCGERYIRKFDLMNHLKIHAYVPETDTMEEELLEDSDSDSKVRKRQKPFMQQTKKKKVKRPKIEYGYDTKPSGSRTYNYVDEDVRLLEAMDSTAANMDYSEYMNSDANSQPVENRFPITDPRKPFVCQHCGVGFAREKALASHSRIHAGDSPFECRRCGEMFWDANRMRDHMKTKHDGVEDDFLDEDDDYSEEEKYGEFFCSTCGMTFHRQDLLKRHQRVHIKEEFVNEVEFSNKIEFGHVCNVCGESFPEALDLLAHAEVHARNSECRCMICGEICSDDQALAAHVQSEHGKSLPPNTCLHCGRTCKDKRTLMNHTLEHTKEKSFSCSKCPKTFHNKARLKRHMLSHRNKAVSCNVCGEHFPDGRSLMNHRHSHSSVSGRQFPCRECGKTFGSRSSQQIHIRIHTGERPYGCRFCWKAFADGGTLRKHERIHTGEKPYACAVCPRAFNQRVVLREHIRSHHSGPDPNYTHSMTPYCCSVCSDMFSTSQDLIIHLIHHCDMNTAMRRQPQVGPRKYKRRRKLKPHELEYMTNPMEEEYEDDQAQQQQQQSQPIYSESDEDGDRRRKKKQRKNSTRSNEDFSEVYNDLNSPPLDNSLNFMTVKTPKAKKKMKDTSLASSRPKMIHTQKTRVPIEASDGGKIRHRTKTLVTRTAPDFKNSLGDRIRPRTKNVSYHILNPDKLPLATFPDDDTQQAVNSLLENENFEPNGLEDEEILTKHSPKKANNSLEPGRHIIGPGQIVKFVKSGMIVSKKKIKAEDDQLEIQENVIEEMVDNTIFIKQEVSDNPLNEFADISMQHAQSIFKCEMCSASFTDRAQLLVHVPIHI